jgi:3-phenylpropionate/cinnamic acid dioxygenase small subunit
MGVTTGPVAPELAVRDVIAAIAHTCDWGTVDEYLEHLTDDAVWSMPPNPALGLDATTRTGRAEVRAGVEERRRLGLQGPGSRTMHVVQTIQIVAVDGVDVTTRASWLYLAARDEGVVVQSLGRYDDRFRADATGRWRLSERVVTFL